MKSVNNIYDQSSVAVLFPVNKLFIRTSEAQACCVQVECAGSSRPQLLEAIQLSNHICINTSVINMFRGKVECSKSTGFSLLMMLARASADMLDVSQLHLFLFNYLFG